MTSDAVKSVSIYGSPRRCGGQGDILSGRQVLPCVFIVLDEYGFFSLNTLFIFLIQRAKKPEVHEFLYIKV